jgi:hypothetical protein
MEKVTIEFTVDRDSLNRYLGNTPNVTLEKAMLEFLGCLHTDVIYPDSHGSYTEETGIKASYKVIPRNINEEVA